MSLTDVDPLKSIPLFAALSDEERRDLAGFLKATPYVNHQPIFWIGDMGAEFFIIQHGRVVLSCPDEGGNEMEVAVLGPGSFFGEISLLDGGPRTTSARAQGDLTLLSLGRDEFLQFLRTKPAASIHIMTILGQRTRGMLDKLRGVKNVNEAVDETTTTWHRTADRVAQIMSSPSFLIGQIVLITVWVIINQLQGGKAFDIYPYCLLALILSGEALFLSAFILASQNRQGQRDRIRADLDYQVNVKAHLEVIQLHQKLDRLAAALGKDINADLTETEIPAAAGGKPG